MCESTIYQALTDASKVILTGKFIAVSAFIEKEDLK
jgi:hypothetical protein